MPVKPRIPATIDTRKKTSAHFKSVIVLSFSIPPPHRRHDRNRRSNFGRWNWFRQRDKSWSPPLIGINYRRLFRGNPAYAGSPPAGPFGGSPDTRATVSVLVHCS